MLQTNLSTQLLPISQSLQPRSNPVRPDPFPGGREPNAHVLRLVGIGRLLTTLAAFSFRDIGLPSQLYFSIWLNEHFKELNMMVEGFGHDCPSHSPSLFFAFPWLSMIGRYSPPRSSACLSSEHTRLVNYV